MILLFPRLSKPNWLSKSAWNAGLKWAFGLVGKKWKDEFLPKHFTRIGAAEYGYRPRTDNYNRKKQRKFGHQDPFVYTGYMKAHLEGVSGASVASTSRKVRIVLNGGQAANYTKRHSELTAVSRKERKALSRFLVAKVSEWLSKVTGVRRMRIAG